MGIFDRFKKNKPSKEGYHFIVMEDREPDPKPVFETVEGNAPKTACHVITGEYVRKLYRSGGNSKHYSVTVSDETLRKFAGFDYLLSIGSLNAWNVVELPAPVQDPDVDIKIRARKNSNSVTIHFIRATKPYVLLCVFDENTLWFRFFDTREEAENAD